jgi:D-alanyl-D-alanine carboxypeptidase
VKRRLWFGLLLATACGDDGGGAAWMPGDTDGSSTGMTGASSATTNTTTAGSSSTTGTTGDPDEPGDPFDPVPPYEPLPDDRLQGLRAVIDGALASPSVAGTTMGVLVVDLETDQVLFERAPDDVLVPASNTKLFTTAATVDVLGIGHRPAVHAFAAATPDQNGAVTDLYIVSEHDFTWSSAFFDSSRFVADRLAQSLYDAGVRQVTGTVSVRGEYVVEGYSLGAYDEATERTEAAGEVASALTAAGITAPAPTTSAEFTAPGGAVELATWHAMAVGEAETFINSPSHNEFADILLRHFGFEQNGLSDYPQAGVAVRDWMAGLPTDTGEVIWNDGSGLSHGNRVSPRNIVDLLRFMTTVPEGETWTRTLSIGGVRGTLSGRMGGPDLVGRVWAKTGTLPSIGVVATSGTLFQRHDGRRYVFSQLFNGAPDVTAARSVQDTVVAAFATDIREAGPRPETPTLRSVVAESSTVIDIQWDPVPDADGYAVWLSPDGHTWSVDDARLVDGPAHRAGDLPFGPTVHVRVTAVSLADRGPVHSVASDVYAASVEDVAARILIVDGNDRWQSSDQPENPLGVGHPFGSDYAEALQSRAFDTVANETLTDGDVSLTDYDAAVWMLGEESDAGRTFDDDEQPLVTAFVEQGGHFMVSGSELGYDLVELGTPADAAFFSDTLGARYQSDDAGTPLARGRGELAGVDPEWIGVTRPAWLSVGFPDRLGPADGAEVWMDYVGGMGGAAMVARPGEGARGTVVVMGIPFEAVDDPAQRRDIMERVLAFFGL